MAGTAIKQAHAQTGLQLPNQNAEPGLRNVDARGGFAEAAFFANGNKGLQLAQ
jgi:hypothetical protein